MPQHLHSLVPAEKVDEVLAAVTAPDDDGSAVAAGVEAVLPSMTASQLEPLFDWTVRALTAADLPGLHRLVHTVSDVPLLVAARSAADRSGPTARSGSRPAWLTPCPRPPTTGTTNLPAPNLIADPAKILDVPADLIAPCLDELAAAEGVVREQVPAAAVSAQAETAPQVPAVYLPPFYQAERSWRTPSSACTPPAPTGWPPSPPSTGTRP